MNLSLQDMLIHCWKWSSSIFGLFLFVCLFVFCLFLFFCFLSLFCFVLFCFLFCFVLFCFFFKYSYLLIASPSRTLKAAISFPNLLFCLPLHLFAILGCHHIIPRPFLFCFFFLIFNVLVELLLFGTKMLNFSGVNAFWNKKPTLFDKNHTVKFTRNTHYWDRGFLFSFFFFFFFFFFLFEKKGLIPWNLCGNTTHWYQ